MKKKALNKIIKKGKKRKLSINGDKAEEEMKSKFEINKDYGFTNYSEMIAKNIVEKIMINVFIEINAKNLYSLMPIQCSNHLFKEINSLLSLSYICYEKENSFLSEIEFNDNYLRYESTWDECDITQPSSPILDRWKIYQLNVVKTNNSNMKNHERRKSKVLKNIKITKSDLIDSKNINIKNTPKTQRNENNYEYLDVIEKDKMQREALKLFDSFPSFPIAEVKHKTNLTKEEEAQIESLREEILLKEEKKRLQLLKLNSRQEKDIKEKELEEKNEYKGKKIGVTTNGEILFIQSINVKNLKSEFLEISSRMKNDLENSKKTSLDNNLQKNKKNSNLSDKKQIEKNKENKEKNIIFKESIKNRINQQIIIGGSSFNNFVPEIGVNLRQGNGVKSGGNDFMNKYNKISYEQFEKTLEMFKKTNKENKELLEIKNENENISTVKSRNKKNNDLNNTNNTKIINNFNISNNIANTNFTKIRNTTFHDFNLSNPVNKNFERSSSLPDLFKTNLISNMSDKNGTNNNSNNINNDLMIKKSFNFTNYNNNSNFNINNSTKYNNYNYNRNNTSNLLKTTSSFKNIFFNSEVKNIENKNNNNISTTSTNFFINFNKNYKILSRPQNASISLEKMQTFNSDIVKDINWGIISQEKEIKNYNEIPFINVVKNSLDKNILRVRSNINEIYTRRMNMANKLSFRKIENEIKEYRDKNKRNLYKKSKSIK